MKKRFAFVTLLIAMVVLTQIPVSLVNAKDVGLKPISGSDCDPTTFEYDGHTIAEGFAVSISAQIPFFRDTSIKFGGAVAGLGESWEEESPYLHYRYTPFVKEMRLKVEGEAPYTDDADSIYDNTGTGGSSLETFAVPLAIIGIIFNAWQIYDWLAEIYETPPDAEWDTNGHWSEAIVRQKTEPAIYDPYVNPDNPRLQTATAIVEGRFSTPPTEDLTVTAEAEIYVQCWDIRNARNYHFDVGTYSVSFEVSLDPVCAMKTLTDGDFYVPNVATGLLKIEMLFDNQNIIGDQTGGTSPYGSIEHYPDGNVRVDDVSFVASRFGLDEGDEGWDYMADVVPDKVVDIVDISTVAHNFGKSGTYITSLAEVTVTFDVGGTKSPDDDGYVTIPEGATSFTVKRYGTPIGAMIVFW